MILSPSLHLSTQYMPDRVWSCGTGQKQQQQQQQQRQDEQFGMTLNLRYLIRAAALRLHSAFFIKCAPLQNVCSQSRLQFVITLFITINVHQRSTLAVYSKHLLQYLIVLFIINKCAPLKNISVQSRLMQSVIGFFIMFKCAPLPSHNSRCHLSCVIRVFRMT